jgi:hypothetical protein
MTPRHSATFGRALATGLLTALALAAGAQQGIAGKWNASVETAQGPFAFQLEFAVAGNQLTGTMTNEFTGTTPITNGTVDGKDVAFKITFAGPDGSIVINYTGAVSGDELKLTSKFEGAPPGGGPAEIVFAAARAK